MDKYAVLFDAIDRLSAFAESKVYGPYKRRDGRQIVIVRENGKSRTVSYPKYLLEQHLGRQLDSDKETIDHIDRDHSNNDLNNLRIMPRAEHSAADTKRVKLIKLNCSMCGKEFERSPRLIREQAKKGARGVFCGKSCSNRANRLLQLGLIKKFPKQKPIKSEYYRNIKDVEAKIDLFEQLVA